MGTRRKDKLRPFVVSVAEKESNFDLLDLKNYINYGDQAYDVLNQHIAGAPQKMLNIRNLTGSIP